jgi:hypothetical protein
MARQPRNHSLTAATSLLIIALITCCSIAMAARGSREGQQAARSVHGKLPEVGRRERLYAGLGHQVQRHRALDDNGSGVEGLGNIMRQVNCWLSTACTCDQSTFSCWTNCALFGSDNMVMHHSCATDAAQDGAASGGL